MPTYWVWNMVHFCIKTLHILYHHMELMVFSVMRVRIILIQRKPRLPIRSLHKSAKNWIFVCIFNLYIFFCVSITAKTIIKTKKKINITWNNQNAGNLSLKTGGFRLMQEILQDNFNARNTWWLRESSGQCGRVGILLNIH